MKPFYYSCVVDNNAMFYYQTWNLVHSLIIKSKVPPQNIFVHSTKEVDEYFILEMINLGVNNIRIDRFADGKYCNKIVQLNTFASIEAECVYFLDTDMIVLENLEHIYNPKKIAGKIVDKANPDLKVLINIFVLAGYNNFPSICNTDYQKNKKTFRNNLNGGLYVIPGNIIKALNNSWKKWALWLKDNPKPLLDAGKIAHIDQVSFSLATHELDIEISLLDSKYNYPNHLPGKKRGAPAIIHYHRSLSSSGLLTLPDEADSDYINSINEANDLILNSYNNTLFWRLRYFAHKKRGLMLTEDQLI